MDNWGIWVVILILAYAVLRLWRWTEERLKNHVKHITDLEYEAKSLREQSTYHREEIDRLEKTKLDKEEFRGR